MRNAGLFDGLPSNLCEITNWAVPVPEPTALVLFAIGCGALSLTRCRQTTSNNLPGLLILAPRRLVARQWLPSISPRLSICEPVGISANTHRF